MRNRRPLELPPVARVGRGEQQVHPLVSHRLADAVPPSLPLFNRELGELR